MGEALATRLIARHAWNRIDGIEKGIGIVRSVVVIDVAKILVASTDADVVTEETVRRGTADCKRGLMIKRRVSDGEARIGVTWIRAGLDDLIDVTGNTLCV